MTFDIGHKENICFIFSRVLLWVFKLFLIQNDFDIDHKENIFLYSRVK